MVQLKICGMRPGDDLSFTRHPEITHVGFIFVPESRRCVTAADAAEMGKHIDDSCKKVGVFVNELLHRVIDTARTAALDVIQLHGNESIETCETLKDMGWTVWKSLSVHREENTDGLVQTIETYAPHVDAILLDAAPPKDAGKSVTGGHGVSFDWSKLSELNEQMKSNLVVPIWVAGGIRPDNAATLLDTYQPFGLDVSSGVEENGRKSNQLIEAMREAVRHYENNHTAAR